MHACFKEKYIYNHLVDFEMRSMQGTNRHAASRKHAPYKIHMHIYTLNAGLTDANWITRTQEQCCPRTPECVFHYVVRISAQ